MNYCVSFACGVALHNGSEVMMALVRASCPQHRDEAQMIGLADLDQVWSICLHSELILIHWSRHVTS